MKRSLIIHLIVIAAVTVCAVAFAPFVFAQETNQKRFSPEAIRKAAAERTEAVKEALQRKSEGVREQGEQAAERAQEVRKDIADRTKEQIKKFVEKLAARLEAAAERLENIADRTESRIEKLADKGADMAEATRRLAIAREKIADAKQHIAEIPKTLEAILSSENPREAFTTARQELKEGHDAILEARRALSETVQAIRVAAGKDADDDTATTTPSTN